MYPSKFAAFDVSETAYKVVNGQDIKAFVMTPKGLKGGKYPLIGQFHGGFFITGASLYADWFAQWVLDYAILHSAIIVSGDYRLLPESNGSDILEDLSDFWAWVRGSMGTHLSEVHAGIEADLTRVMVYGASAGGTLAIQSGFTQPKGFIKAAVPTYPWVEHPGARTAPIMGAPIVPPNVLADYLKTMVPGKIVTSADPPERLDIALSIVQQGLQDKFWGNEDRLFPMRAVKTIDVDKVPYMLILHGVDDTAVPIANSIEFAELVKERCGEGRVYLRTESGGHGFDGEATLETPWLKEGLKKVTELWLS